MGSIDGSPIFVFRYIKVGGAGCVVVDYTPSNLYLWLSLAAYTSDLLGFTTCIPPIFSCKPVGTASGTSLYGSFSMHHCTLAIQSAPCHTV